MLLRSAQCSKQLPPEHDEGLDMDRTLTVWPDAGTAGLTRFRSRYRPGAPSGRTAATGTGCPSCPARSCPALHAGYHCEAVCEAAVDDYHTLDTPEPHASVLTQTRAGGQKEQPCKPGQA